MANWQSIDTAPKGGGADLVTDPAWVEPPKILMRFEDGEICVAYWDWYYAKGGSGYSDGTAWMVLCTGEQADLHFGEPTHWMPLPEQPSQ